MTIAFNKAGALVTLFFTLMFRFFCVLLALLVAFASCNHRVAKITSLPRSGHYIVVLNKKRGEVSSNKVTLHHEWLQSEIDLYHPQSQVNGKFHVPSSNNGEFRGYFGEFENELVQKLQDHEDIAYVSVDQQYHLKYHLEGLLMKSEKNQEVIFQEDAPWGLARLSSRKIPSNYGHYVSYLKGRELTNIQV